MGKKQNCTLSQRKPLCPTQVLVQHDQDELFVMGSCVHGVWSHLRTPWPYSFCSETLQFPSCSLGAVPGSLLDFCFPLSDNFRCCQSIACSMAVHCQFVACSYGSSESNYGSHSSFRFRKDVACSSRLNFNVFGHMAQGQNS